MLLVQNAIFMLVCLNKLVMNVVSFPMYVNVAHFCVGVCVWPIAVFVVWGCVVYVVVDGVFLL